MQYVKTRKYLKFSYHKQTHGYWQHRMSKLEPDILIPTKLSHVLIMVTPVL